MQILLDIDGVMLPANAWRVPEILPDGFVAFSPRATAALKKLLAETPATILLTSSHKNRFTVDEWKSIFALRGISVSKIETLPKAADGTSRLDEILAWAKAQGSETPFVIIDDDKGLNALPPHLKNRLILASGTIGLTDELVGDAIRLLLSERSPALARFVPR